MGSRPAFGEPKKEYLVNTTTYTIEFGAAKTKPVKEALSGIQWIGTLSDPAGFVLWQGTERRTEH
jgi:hypothetical protein